MGGGAATPLLGRGGTTTGLAEYRPNCTKDAMAVGLLHGGPKAVSLAAGVWGPGGGAPFLKASG
eukprot:5345272-Alexandrium_andersonii.AAC.1